MHTYRIPRGQPSTKPFFRVQEKMKSRIRENYMCMSSKKRVIITPRGVAVRAMPAALMPGVPRGVKRPAPAGPKMVMGPWWYPLWKIDSAEAIANVSPDEDLFPTVRNKTSQRG